MSYLLHYNKQLPAKTRGIFGPQYSKLAKDSSGRDPLFRIASLPVDFTGLNVLDLGCNSGAILLSLKDKIHSGVGVDINRNNINAANYLGMGSCLRFYVVDLDIDDFDLLTALMPGASYDVTFMLSIANWVKRWKDLLLYVKGISKQVVFESHGKHKLAQEQFLSEIFSKVDFRGDSYDGGNLRSLFICGP